MIPFKLRLIREQNRIYTTILKVLSKLKKNGIKVYLFHDILNDKSEVKSQFSISEQSFEFFLRNQLENGQKPITFQELKDSIITHTSITNGFIISFDDANESVITKAYPILKNYNIPFIIFINTELIGRENFLSEQQIRLLLQDPLCSIGSHGCHHKMFRYLSDEEVKKELEESKKNLENTFATKIDCFAFPYGRLVECSKQNIECAKNSSYLFSFSTISGTLKIAWLTGKHFLPRINVDEKLVARLT